MKRLRDFRYLIPYIGVVVVPFSNKINENEIPHDIMLSQNHQTTNLVVDT